MLNIGTDNRSTPSTALKCCFTPVGQSGLAGLYDSYVYYSLIINTLQCPDKPFCPCNAVCFQVHIWCNYNDYGFNTVSWQTILSLQCSVFSGSHMV